jgi:tRNA U38,U39,U40 pseudouridine synthase TruA
VFHTWHDLELEPMQRAAALIVGEHDFEAFAQASHGRKSTVREVFACDVEEGIGNPGMRTKGESRFVIRVSGSGFLYNMVRIIAGTLMEVGRGKIPPEQIPAILESKDRKKRGPTLPPQGLRLEWIRYVVGVSAAEKRSGGASECRGEAEHDERHRWIPVFVLEPEVDADQRADRCDRDEYQVDHDRTHERR